MRNDDIRRILNAQEVLQRQLEPISKAIESITRFQSIIPDMQDILGLQESARVALGPLEDMRRSGYLELFSKLHNQISGLGSLLEIEQRFLLPEVPDVAKLLGEYASRNELDLVKRYQQELSVLRGLAEAMHTPWLDVANQIQSINGFAGLHGIGSLLRTFHAFDANLVDVLRFDLGDWREEITWPSGIASDPLVRTSVYIQQGLNPELTAFPNTAFEEILNEAGLGALQVPGAEAYRLHRESDELEQEAAFERTNDAHDLLQRFESQLRKFINERMEETFGGAWIKHRIPGDMRDRWLKNQRQAGGKQQWPIIAYADFTDYVTIITRNDNWQDLFEAVFVNKSSVQESFRRLFPIRLATMHSRLITQDDELYLYVETKRILSAIGGDI